MKISDISKEDLQGLAKQIQKEIEGLGFALFIFEFHKAGQALYISNAQRQDMIKAIEEKVKIFKARQDNDFTKN